MLRIQSSVFVFALACGIAAPVMGQTPLVMFYPGKYDGQSLRLFGKLKNNNYYRAFKLVP